MAEERKTLTVGALIDLLAEVDSSLPVSVEGCDCIGKAKGIDVRTEKDRYGNEPGVLIER
jgi:hypothetical protein